MKYAVWRVGAALGSAVTDPAVVFGGPQGLCGSVSIGRSRMLRVSLHTSPTVVGTAGRTAGPAWQGRDEQSPRTSVVWGVCLKDSDGDSEPLDDDVEFTVTRR